MKKIITAIDNPALNKKLKNEDNFKIIGKDIQYKEAILEILEKENNVDIIIIKESIPGEIKLEELIKKIKEINKKVKLYFIFEKEDFEKEKICKKYKIKYIYYDKTINLDSITKIINNNEIKIKNNKNIEVTKNNNKIKKEILKNKIENKKTINKIIIISGNNKSGKSIISILVSFYLSEKNKKVLLIDFNFKNNKIKKILKNKKQNNNFNIEDGKNLLIDKKNVNVKKLEEFNRKYNYVIICLHNNIYYNIRKQIIEKSDKILIITEGNLLGIKQIQGVLELYIKKLKKQKESLHIVVNKKNKDTINKKIIEDSLNNVKIINEINFDNKYILLNDNFIKNKKILEKKIIKNNINKIIKKIK